MFAAILRRLLAATAAAAILTAVTLLVPDRFDAANPFNASSAAARNGGDNSGSGGGGDDGGSGGSDNSGHGSDNSGHGGDNSGPGGDDNSGPGGDDNSGPGGGDDDDGHENDLGYSDGHYVDGDTGARIEIDGGKIEIVYPDGWKEELEDGIFELKDPSGRTVIERRATGEDVARLRAIVN
jgi:hypothetical protein